ncbi:MAG: hypothetical protein ROO76_23855 [Terriglobia bacterium]|nr:hypothetical protein [Terriglobia bacterium]
MDEQIKERLETLQGIIVGVDLEVKRLARFVAAMSETHDRHQKAFVDRLGDHDIQDSILADRCTELSVRVHKLEAILRSYGIAEMLEPRSESQG